MKVDSVAVAGVGTAGETFVVQVEVTLPGIDDLTVGQARVLTLAWARQARDEIEFSYDPVEETEETGAP